MRSKFLLVCFLVLFEFRAQAIRCGHFVESAKTSSSSTWINLSERLASLRIKAHEIKGRLHRMSNQDFLLSISEVEALALEISYNSSFFRRYALTEVTSAKAEFEDLVLEFRKDFFSLEIMGRIRAIEGNALMPDKVRSWAQRLLISTLSLNEGKSGAVLRGLEEVYLTQMEKIGERPLFTITNFADFAGTSGMALSEMGKDVLGYNRNDFHLLMQTLRDRGLRERIFRAYHGVDFNEAVSSMAEILIFRSRELEGESIAENLFSVRESNGELSLSRVQGYVERIRAQATSAIARELELLSDLARRHGILDEIKPWDVNYLIREYYQERGSLDNQFSPYFRVSEALRVLNVVIHSMSLEIKFSGREVFKGIPVLELYDTITRDHLGDIQLDIFSREGKIRNSGSSNILKIPGEFSHASSRERGKLGVTHISMNVSSKRDYWMNEVLAFEELATFFHEFGHTLHQILPRGLSALARIGTHTKDHLIEVPALLFEEVLRSTDVLSLFEHATTREPMPRDLVMKAQEVLSRRFTWLERDADLLFAVEFDLAVHSLKNPDYGAKDPIYGLLAPREIGPLPFPILLNSHSHGHIFGYGYETMLSTYLIGGRIARDYVKMVMPQGVFESNWGPQFRREVLEAGAEFDIEGDLHTP